MFRLDRHIEILLLKHDCVILPGFGGFVAHHVSARLDESDGVMLPPMTVVGFNPQLTINDSLLVQSYVEAYDYSYPEALQIVEDEIEQLKDMLHSYGSFEIHSVGTLSVNNGIYNFEPTPSGILVPDYYALTGVDTNNADCFLSSASAKSDVDQSRAVQKGDKFIVISTNALRRAAVACAVMLFLISVPLIGHHVNTTNIISGIDTEFFTRLFLSTDEGNQGAFSEKSEKKVKTIVVMPKKKATADEAAGDGREEQIKEKAEDVSLIEVPQKDVYTVVIASRISRSNAEEYVEKLHSKGMTDARVIGEGKARKIVYGQFSTMEAAQQMQRQLSADKEFADVWTLKL